MPTGLPPAPSDRSALGPSAAMAVHGMLDHDPEEDAITDGRKAKRELSQSKRAAQNRAAQRAFRQRKEHYIKKLEQQVRDYGELEHNYKAMQNDNYALREYVIQLQSRLMDHQVDLPQPPSNLNITPPAPTASRSVPSAPRETMAERPSSTTSAGTLADVAAAVAGLRAREPSADGLYPKPPMKYEPRAEDHGRHDDDHLRRPLQRHEPLPPPSSLRV